MIESPGQAGCIDYWNCLQGFLSTAAWVSQYEDLLPID